MDGLSSSCSSVLLLGEGNLSFARSLSKKLSDGRDVRIIATSFEKEDAVVRRINGRQNIEALQQNGVTCLFSIDATKIHNCQALEGRQFEGIIFNFPHIPGKANIARNRDLLKNFFKSGMQKLSPSGQVLVTLCNGQGGTPADNPQREPQNSWQVVAMATYGDLILTQTVPFRAGEYQEYDSTGYRGQDKGFLTQGAITHVFERSQPIPVHQATDETFPASVDGQHIPYRCPGDLGMFLTRNLLADKNHPLNCLATALVSTIQKEFPHVKQRREDGHAKICHGKENNACSGVYTLQEPLNIHKAGGHSTEVACLRPHLLYDMDSLIDRYANDGCILTGKCFHRCAISCKKFPMMHQLLLALPQGASDASWEDMVTKLLEGIYSNRSKLKMSTRNTDKNVNSGPLFGVGPTDSGHSLKRSHCESEDSGKLPSGMTGGMDHVNQCVVCFDGIISNESVIHLTETCESGNQTAVGLCGTVTRDSATYDIILLFLDHLIMHLLHIDDIRLLWSTDTHMWDEPKTHPPKKINSDLEHRSGLFTGMPFLLRSRYPPLYVRDVSFWCQTEGEFDELRFMSVIRQATGLLTRQVSLRDVYRDETRGDLSRCYRIEYLSCDRALSKEKLAMIHQRVLELIRQEMGLTAR